MINEKFVLLELERTRNYFVHLNIDEFFCGPLFPGKAHAPPDALYIRSNFATNHLIESNDHSLVVLDRRWFEYAAILFTIQYAIMHAAKKVNFSVKTDKLMSRIYCGFTIRAMTEFMITESDDSVDQAAMLLQAAKDDLAYHSLFETEFFKQKTSQDNLSEQLLPVMAYEHERGHVLLSPCARRLEQEIQTIVPQLYEKLDMLVTAQGGSFQGDAASISEFVLQGSKKYDERISSICWTLQGLAQNTIYLEVLADFHMIEAVYDKFIQQVEFTKPHWKDHGRDIYLFSGIMCYLEYNNIISGCFVREDLRLGKGVIGDAVSRGMFHIVEKTTRLMMARMFVLSFVRRSRTVEREDIGLKPSHRLIYDFDAFDDEFSLSESRRDNIFRSLNEYFNEKYGDIIVKIPEKKLSQATRLKAVESILSALKLIECKPHKA